MILITDRTAADVANDTAKGNYNHTDRNRVGNAVNTIAALLRAFDYTVPVDPKTDWGEDDYPTAALMAAYLADVVTLCDVYNTIPSRGALRPLPDSLRFMDYKIANNIEKNLLVINGLASSLERSFENCGELFAGE